MVKAFLEKQNLKQPVLLKGGDVAAAKYFVTGFPTRFWIGKDGKVLSHGVGFGPGSEKDLRATAARLLAEKPGDR